MAIKTNVIDIENLTNNYRGKIYSTSLKKVYHYNACQLSCFDVSN